MMSDRAQSRNRLWIVSALYYPEEASTSCYLARIAEGLADEFDVKVICGQRNYSAHGVKAPRHEIHNGVEIFRCAGMLTIPTLCTAFKHFKKGDRVLVDSTPPSMPFFVAVASLFRGAAYMLLIHDEDTRKDRADSMLVHVIDYFDRWLYKYTAKIIVVGRDMRESIEQKAAGLDIPIDVIPNWAIALERYRATLK